METQEEEHAKEKDAIAQEYRKKIEEQGKYISILE